MNSKDSQSIKLEVPFYKQTTKTNCGSVVLHMVMSYLDKDIDLEILEKIIKINEGKAVLTIQIAIASALSGFPTEFFSKKISFNKENLKLEFYQKYLDNKVDHEKLIEEAKNVGVKIEERRMPIEELLRNVTNKTIPIILLDWNVIKGESGYQGHFVPIVGYDNESVYVHNNGLNNPTPFLKIKRELFEQARKSEGTDEDIIIIHRKVW